MSATSTVPAWALPGLIHSPGLAAWKVTVTLACTAAAATSPVEASTPLGTSTLSTLAPAAAERLDRACHLSAGLALKAGARAARPPPAPAPAAQRSSAGAGRGARRTLLVFGPRHPVEVQRRRAGQALEVGAGVSGQLFGGGHADHVDLAAAVAQHPRHDEPVAAVVALAAEDRRPARREPSARRRG